MFIEFTKEALAAYDADDDGLDAIEKLGVPKSRMESDGVKRDDGSIEKYENFHSRVFAERRDGGAGIVI